MSYIISKSDNETLVVIQDGQVDQVTTSLFLVGKNVSGYGTDQNENLVYLLENFAKSSAESPSGQPRSPMKGQFWFDTNPANNRMMFYDGSVWRPVGVTIVGTTSTNTTTNATSSPRINFAASQAGDMWFNNSSNQLYVIASTTTGAILIGPEAVDGFGLTKMLSVGMYDINGIRHPVIQTILNEEIIQIFSSATFISTTTNAVVGFPVVYRGTTVKNYNSSTRYTTATTDVILHGLHEQLDQTYPRRNVNELITSDWSMSNSLYFGTLTQSSVTWNNGLYLTTTNVIVLQSTTTSLTFDGLSLNPSTSTVSLGLSSSPFTSVYSSKISSGNTTTSATLEGVWNVSAGQFNPTYDAFTWLGTSAQRFLTVYTTGIDAGLSSNVGTINGTWNLTTNSSISPVVDLAASLGTTSARFSNVFASTISTGNTNNTGNIIGQWAINTSSKISPVVDLAASLGTTSTRFQTVFTQNVNGIEAINGSFTLTGTLTSLGNLLPGVNSTYAIGTNSSRWGTLNVVTATIDTINASTIGTTSLTANSGIFSTSASGPLANFTQVLTGNGQITSLAAGTATVTNLTVTTGAVTSLSATTLQATNATITNLTDAVSHTITKFDPDGTLAANTDAYLATQKAIKTYVDNTSTYLQSLISALQALINALPAAQPVPAGTVMFAAMSSPPTGFIVCDGSSYSTSSFPALFDAIRYQFGGSGSNFSVPDLRGQFVRGWDNGAGTDPGRFFGSTQADAYRSHTHSVGTGYFNQGFVGTVSGSTGPQATIATGASGGTETRPTNVALLPIIKT